MLYIMRGSHLATLCFHDIAVRRHSSALSAAFALPFSSTMTSSTHDGQAWLADKEGKHLHPASGDEHVLSLYVRGVLKYK